MKKPMLILLILLLGSAAALGLIARRQPAAVQTMASATATPTAEPTATPTATPTAEPTATPTATPTAEPTTTPTATPTAEPTSAPTPEAVGGDMSLTVPGYGGDVTVSITVDAQGLITAMTVEADAEAPGLGRKCAEERWTAQFIGKTAPFALTAEAGDGANAVDAVSYATITSQAIINAVNTLLNVE